MDSTLKKRLGFVIFLLFIISLFLTAVLAHGEEEDHEEEESLAKVLKSKALQYVLITSAFIAVLVAISIALKEKSEALKWVLFLGISLPVIFSTVYLAGSTIYVNLISETGGPVHWHADFEFYNCGKELQLEKPEGLSNKVGNAVLHEHNDNRIHVEGVLIEKKEVDLHNFLGVVGGVLEDGFLRIPTEEGDVSMQDGERCKGQPSKLQVFLYEVKNPENVNNWVFEQRKLEDYENHILSPYSEVPPGDCIIFEFGPEKGRTDRVCESYRVAVERGELVGS